jgi:hypothetical protein
LRDGGVLVFSRGTLLYDTSYVKAQPNKLITEPFEVPLDPIFHNL